MRTFRLHVRIDNDLSHLDPNAEDGCWRLVSFNRRHRGHESPDNWFEGDAALATRDRLKAGEVFVLSCYQHSGTVWSLKGEGPQCRWDTAQVAGVLVCDDPAQLPEGYEAREKSARAFVTYFTAWCNGWGFGFELEQLVPVATDDGVSGDGEVTETKHLDSCWGFVGEDHEASGVLSAAADALNGVRFDPMQDKLEITGDAAPSRAALDEELAAIKAWREGPGAVLRAMGPAAGTVAP